MALRCLSKYACDPPNLEFKGEKKGKVLIVEEFLGIPSVRRSFKLNGLNMDG